MAILKIKDDTGNIIDIPAIRGKSAYECAQEGGFKGTEEEFKSLLGGLQDWADNALESSSNVSYATCDTEAEIAEKTVTISNNDNWKLNVGTVVMIYFSISNSVSNVKLNVNGTGAYPIWYNNAEYTSTGTAYTGYAKRVIVYMFNGTHWVWISSSYDTNTTYTNASLGQGYVTCSTDASTTAKVGALSSYKLVTGGIVSVKFTNAVPANATLNVNSTGAKAIYYRGAKITADVIKAGDVATFIYSSQYHLISIDRWQNDITSLEKTIADLNPLYGKKVTFNGDSICAGAGFTGGYGKIIAERNNMTYQNIAHGGATITAETYSGSSGNALHWICRTISQMDAESDYAIVEGGVNDPNYVTNMGSLSDGFDAVLDDTTYYGAFESMLKQLVTRFAGKKVGYIAIPKVSSNFDSRSDADSCYHIALECCEKWGVPVCDLNTCVPPLGYIDTLSDTYTTDGTHPNEAGYKAYYCDQIEAWMKNLATSSRSVKSVVKEHNVDKESHADIRDLVKKLQSGKLNAEGVSVKTIQTKLADGTTVNIDVLVVSEGAVVIPYINQVPLSIDASGNIYNEVGYKNGYRLNSKGEEASVVSCCVTGFIKAKAGDTIYIKGYKWYDPAPSSCYLCAYNASFAKVYVGNSQTNYDSTTFIESMSYDEETGISTVKLKSGLSYEYIRLSVYDTLIPDGKNLIVTVNQEIKE